MTDVNDKTIALEEWKARYESYRSYRGHYLTVLSITLTTWTVGFGFSMSRDLYFAGRLCILIALIAITVGLVVAHMIARRAIRELGRRIELFQTRLALDGFATTQPLERAIVYSHSAAIVLTLVTCVALATTWWLGN